MATDKDRYCLITRNILDIYPIIAKLANESIEYPIPYLTYEVDNNAIIKGSTEENLKKIRELLDEIFMVSYCEVQRYRKIEEKKMQNKMQNKKKRLNVR